MKVKERQVFKSDFGELFITVAQFPVCRSHKIFWLCLNGTHNKKHKMILVDQEQLLSKEFKNITNDLRKE